jgi:putative transposase
VAEANEVDQLLDQMLKGKTPEEILGRDGVLKGPAKRLVERALEGEMTTHLGYEKHAAEVRNTGNSRNGATGKNVLTGSGELEIEVPRDRNGEFDPQLVKKGQRRLPGLDDKVIALYACGLTTREIQGHLMDLYDVEVSPTLISNVTDAVLEDVRAWQSRPLDAVYPILYLDAIHLKLRSSGAVQNQAVYVALGINLESQKDLLSLWVGESEGAKFWLNELTEVKNRGVRDILIACVDGLKGFPEAIENLYPQTQVQLCIVHLVRNSLRYVSWKERKAIALALCTIYAAPTAEAAEQALEAFAQRWDRRFPSISRVTPLGEGQREIRSRTPSWPR